EAAGTGNAGTVGTALTGAHGALTINSNGAYTYVVNQSDTAVQGLNVGQTITDTFTYTVQDPGGLTDTAQLTITINGADDAPVANNDAGTATDAGGTLNGSAGSNATGNVILGDATGGVADTDVDNATNTLMPYATRFRSEAAGTGNAGTVGTALTGAHG